MKRLKVPYKMLIWALIGLLYSPVYIAAWLLRVIARLLLTIAYLGMLEGKMAKYTFNSIFMFYGQ